MQTTFYFILTLIAALVVAAGIVWLVRRFGPGAQAYARGRIPRLSVIEEIPVDRSQRRLVLIRRDNVEHLLLIGGRTDIVVELNVVRSPAGRDQLPPRIGAEGSGWANETPLPEPRDVPEAPQMPERQVPERPTRPSFVNEVRAPDLARAFDVAEKAQAEENVTEGQVVRTLTPAKKPTRGLSTRPASAATDRPGDTLTNFTVGRLQRDLRPEPMLPRPESMTPRPESMTPRPEPMSPRSEPMTPRPEPMTPRSSRTRSEPLIPRPPRRSEPAKTPMVRAERAERITTQQQQHITTPPHPSASSSVEPASSSVEQNFTEMAQRLEAALRRPNETVAPADTPEPAPAEHPSHNEAAAPTPDGSNKGSFESLEDEMASLLGRTKPSA